MNNLRKSASRRRSHSVLGFFSKDLCETVPKSLSPSERLMMLLQQSFQYALSGAQKKIMHRENCDIVTIKQNGTKCWEKIKTIIEEKDLHKSAVTENGVCESYVEAKVEEYNKAIAEVEAESEKWNNKILHCRKCLEKEINSSYSVTASELEDKNQLYNYSDVISEASLIETTLCNQVQDVSSAGETIKQWLFLQRAHHCGLKRKFEYSVHQHVAETPRKIIKRFASLSRNTRPDDTCK